MVWKINRLSRTGCNMIEDVLFQKTNLLYSIREYKNIIIIVFLFGFGECGNTVEIIDTRNLILYCSHIFKLKWVLIEDPKEDLKKTVPIYVPDSLDYSAFDLYLLWGVGVNIFNIDRTIHDEKFHKDILEKVEEARNYNSSQNYRTIGVSLTVSAKEPVDIQDVVDIIIVKDIKTIEDLISFRKKHSKLGKPILVSLSSYTLDDMNFIIKISDGVILDFYDAEKIIQQYCTNLIKKCRQVQKPIILSRPQLLSVYLGKLRELLPIAKDLVDFNLDGILLNDIRDIAAVVDGVYNVACSMAYIEKIREKEGGDVASYFEIRAVLKLPVSPAFSAAHGAALAAIHSGATLIIILTRSGRSARWISCAYPPCYVLAITTQPATARQLHIYKKIMPLVYDQPSSVNWQLERRKRIQFGTNFALRIGLLSKDAKLVVMLPQGDDGYCNSFQITNVHNYIGLNCSKHLF